MTAQVFTDVHAARTIVAVPRGWHPICARKIRATGATILELPASGFWRALMRELARRDILHVFCEGGGGIAGALLKANLVDELRIFLSPMLIGGPVGATGTTAWRLPQAPGFILRECTPVGKDLLLKLTPKQKEA